MRFKIEFLGLRLDVESLNLKSGTANKITPVFIIIFLAVGLLLLFKAVPSLIFPTLSILCSIKIIRFFKEMKIVKLNEFDSTSRPYVSEMKSEESVPIIEINKLKNGGESRN